MGRKLPSPDNVGGSHCLTWHFPLSLHFTAAAEEEGGSRDDFVVSFDGNSNQERLIRLYTEAQIYYTPMTGQALEVIK